MVSSGGEEGFPTNSPCTCTPLSFANLRRHAITSSPTGGIRSSPSVTSNTSALAMLAKTASRCFDRRRCTGVDGEGLLRVTEVPSVGPSESVGSGDVAVFDPLDSSSAFDHASTTFGDHILLPEGGAIIFCDVAASMVGSSLLMAHLRGRTISVPPPNDEPRKLSKLRSASGPTP